MGNTNALLDSVQVFYSLKLFLLVYIIEHSCLFNVCLPAQGL